MTAGPCPLCGVDGDLLLEAITQLEAARRGEHNLNLDLTARIQHLTSRDTT